MAKISVIMPAYNHERFVSQAIESVLSQTFDDIELVAVDDGSTDGTAEVILGYRDKDSRVICIRQDNQDAYNALNRGLRSAGGEYIAIINSDDIYEKTRLARLIGEQEATGAACVFTDVRPIDEFGNEIGHPDFFWNIWHKANRDFYFERGDLYTAFLHGNIMVSTSNIFMTRDAVKKVGGFSAIRYLHDYDYIFRVMLAYPDGVRYLCDEKLLFYRLHGRNTLSRGAIIAREQDQQIIRKYMLEKIPSELRDFITVGSDRLMMLERELVQERQRFNNAQTGSFRLKCMALLKSISAFVRSVRAYFR